MSDDDWKYWYPSIRSSLDDNRTVLASFRPWDTRASFIMMCLVESVGKKPCQDSVLLFENQTNARFTDVPCNKTYLIKIRSYAAKQYPFQTYYWHSPNVTVPCRNDTKPPITEWSNDGRPGLVPIVLVCGISLVLLAAAVVFFWLKKSENNRFLIKCCSLSDNSKNLTMNNNHNILPVYIHENDSYAKAVQAHIHLLNITAGLNIKTYDEQRKAIQPDKDAWVQACLKESTAAIIYHSKTVDDLRRGKNLPECSGAFGDVCCQILNQLHKHDITVVHVTLLNEENSPDFDNMVKLVNVEGDNVTITSSGTVVQKLTNMKVQKIPTEEQTLEVRKYVRELYDLRDAHFGDRREDSIREWEGVPMLPQHVEDMGQHDHRYMTV